MTSKTNQRCASHSEAATSRPCAQRDDLPQHAQTVAEKANFAAFGMVPPPWNFGNLQTGARDGVEQLHVEGEAGDPGRFKNRSARLEAKRFKSALRIPKGQSGRD